MRQELLVLLESLGKVSGLLSSASSDAIVKVIERDASARREFLDWIAKGEFGAIPPNHLAFIVTRFRDREVVPALLALIDSGDLSALATALPALVDRTMHDDPNAVEKALTRIESLPREQDTDYAVVETLRGLPRTPPVSRFLDKMISDRSLDESVRAAAITIRYSDEWPSDSASDQAPTSRAEAEIGQVDVSSTPPFEGPLLELQVESAMRAAVKLEEIIKELDNVIETAELSEGAIAFLWTVKELSRRLEMRADEAIRTGAWPAGTNDLAEPLGAAAKKARRIENLQVSNIGVGLLNVLATFLSGR